MKHYMITHNPTKNIDIVDRDIFEVLGLLPYIAMQGVEATLGMTIKEAMGVAYFKTAGGLPTWMMADKKCPFRVENDVYYYPEDEPLKALWKMESIHSVDHPEYWVIHIFPYAIVTVQEAGELHYTRMD